MALLHARDAQNFSLGPSFASPEAEDEILLLIGPLREMQKWPPREERFEEIFLDKADRLWQL